MINPDAAAWLAGWILGLVLVGVMAFCIWTYLVSIKTQAHYDLILRQRRQEGKMQIKNVKLYSQEPPVNSGKRIVSK